MKDWIGQHRPRGGCVMVKSRCQLCLLVFLAVSSIGLLAFLWPHSETDSRNTGAPATAGKLVTSNNAQAAGIVADLEKGEPVVAATVAAAIDTINATSPKLFEELYRLARDDVLEILGDGAETCVNWRKSSHQECIDPGLCGKGWLFQQKELLLAVVFASGGADPSAATTAASGAAGSGGPTTDWVHVAGGDDGRAGPLPHPWPAGTPGTVVVVGLREGGGGELSDCDGRDLSMLVRLQGPEALAEAAVPVTGRCAWTTRFQPTLEGVYTLDVTLLNWKGSLEPHRSMCGEVAGQYGEGSVEMDAVRDGPFYGTFEGCCTLCTRHEACVGWSATNDPNKALVNGSRCVLYSSVASPPVEHKRLLQTVRSGIPRAEESMMYLGPSMTIARRWCTEENGSVLGSGGRQFTVTSAATTQGGNQTNEQDTGEGEVGLEVAAAAARADLEGNALPLCRPSNGTPTTRLPREGRWVSLRDTNCPFSSQRTDVSGWPNYNKDIFGGVEMAEECFLKPADRPRPEGELKYAQGGYVWQPYDCRYDLMNTDTRLSCLREKNITRFLDFGDSLISTSRMPRSALWLPTADFSSWSNGKGAPQIGEGAAEAGCVGGPIQYYGEARHQNEDDGSGLPSTATTNRYCGVESYWQIEPGQVRNLVKSFKPDVVLANWAIVHRLWHHTLEEFDVFLKKLGRQLDGMTDTDGHRPRHMFWLSAPFLVSEREPHCVLERGLQFTNAMRDLLEPRGWVEIDWVSMTRKWGFDIVDGMHHGQPPTRMLAYLLMHHVCHASESDR